MKKQSVAFLLAVTLLMGCGSSKQIQVENSWLNREKMKDRPVKNIYIMALFNNPSVSSTLEYVLAEEAKSRRYVAHRNTDEFPYKLDNPEDAKRLILEKANKLGCDAIFVTALKDVHSETHYVSTSSIGVGVSGAAYYPADGYQGNFNSYYTGYYTE